MCLCVHACVCACVCVHVCGVTVFNAPQEELSAAVERKTQLKEELSTVREELVQWKTKYRYNVCMTVKLG